MVGTANGKPPSLPPSNFEVENASSNAEFDSTAGFTRDDVDALLSEKMRYKSKFNYKERCESMQDYVRRLRICLRWFQDLESSYLFDQEKLRTALALSEIKHADAESTLTRKENELNSIILEMKNANTNLEERLASEQAEKSAAVSALSQEHEAKIIAEQLVASANQELAQLNVELQSANQRIIAVNNMYKLLQEYNESTQRCNSRLQVDLDSAHETVKRGEKEKASMVESLSDLRVQYNSLQDTYSSCNESIKEITRHKGEMAEEISTLKAQLQSVKDERDSALNFVTSLRNEVATQESRILKSNEIEERYALQSERLKFVENELEETTNRLKESDLSSFRTQSEFDSQKDLISELRSSLETAEIKLVEGEKVRKKLHNTILELKGNIRVFCRVRPLLPDLTPTNDTYAVSYPTATEVLGRGVDLSHNGQTYSYTYDKVFGHESSQEDVFLEVSQLVQSALDGYKVCIFAYGQTGSGKTYTMMGKPADPKLKGLIPRSLEQIFETRQSLQCQGWKYELQVSMLEIYNETIRDLLAPKENGKQYAIKHDGIGNTHVSDLTLVDVRSSREVAFLLDQAAHSRSVGKTQINEHSSRSHFVFTLRITGVNVATDQQINGVLNLIDLAGSERLSKSGSTGDRLKETQAINKSLSSLSDVIFALAKRDDHIPFRNSKLTYLLQPCLGGDSKTLMVVNISPESSSGGESLCSLRFACRVNACEIGTARRQTNSRLSLG